MKLWNLMLAHPVITSVIVAIIGTIFTSKSVSSALGNIIKSLTGWGVDTSSLTDKGFADLAERIRQMEADMAKPTAVPGNLPTIDPLPTDDTTAEPTEAERRVTMFAWLDDMRSYAIEKKNDKAVASANQLLNDLFTNEGDSHATVNAPTSSPSS